MLKAALVFSSPFTSRMIIIVPNQVRIITVPVLNLRNIAAVNCCISSLYDVNWSLRSKSTGVFHL